MQNFDMETLRLLCPTIVRKVNDAGVKRIHCSVFVVSVCRIHTQIFAQTFMFYLVRSCRQIFLLFKALALHNGCFMS